jgi:hypothetical protein
MQVAPGLLGSTAFAALAAAGAYNMPNPSKKALPSQNVRPVTKAILATSMMPKPQAE